MRRIDTYMNRLESLRNTRTAFTNNGLYIEVDYDFDTTQDDILDWTSRESFGTAAMRVYKFISSDYGLKALREQRLKISEVDSLNDPFDLLPFDLSNPAFRQWLVGERSEIGKSFGLLCFSKQWQNLPLWTHYAENQKGLCLGFDVWDGHRAVEYVDQPVRFTKFNLDFAFKMLFCKHERWRYEEEVRIGVTLTEKSGPYYFKNFGDGLQLAEVIVGPKSLVSRRKIERELGQHSHGIKISKARLVDAFTMVEDQEFGCGGGLGLPG